jgi:hypothetical protein
LALAWIRGPVWDLCWIWGGIPIGISVAFMSPAHRLWFFTIALMVETAHRLSPVALAWTHREFRRREVLPNLGWYVGVPLAVMLVSMVAGTQFEPKWLVQTYLLFNAVHFGLQNFGVLSLYKRNRQRDQVERAADMQLCIGLTFAGTFLLPVWHLSDFTVIAIGMAFSVHHRFVEIALTNNASRNSWFPLVLVTLGLAGFLIYIPTDHGHIYQSYGGTLLAPVGSFAIGISFVHLIYDRWVWKFSRRNVRETIGKSLLTRA